jgi:predicted enzyme related to lactoylglutathione lyase
MSSQNIPILELRVALTTSDYERLMKFYTDALGLKPAELWTTDHSQAALFEMGKATLEIFDEAHAADVDQIEAGRRTGGKIRFALQVPDLQAAMDRLVSKGAVMIHPAVVTPWGDYNVRLEDPDGMQITLFQVAPK